MDSCDLVKKACVVRQLAPCLRALHFRWRRFRLSLFLTPVTSQRRPRFVQARAMCQRHPSVCGDHRQETCKTKYLNCRDKPSPVSHEHGNRGYARGARPADVQRLGDTSSPDELLTRQPGRYPLSRYFSCTPAAESPGRPSGRVPGLTR